MIDLADSVGDATALALPLPVAAVAFDLGGTLTPILAPLLNDIWSQIFDEHLPGRAAAAAHKTLLANEEQYYSGGPDADGDAIHLVSRAIATATADRDADACALASAIVSQAVARFVNEVKVEPGVPQIFTWLSSLGIRIGILTNMILPARAVVEWTKAERLAPYLSAVLVSSDVGLKKPDPDIFALLRGSLGVRRPEDLAFVGNSWSEDMVGAVQTGSRAIYLVGRDPGPPKSHDDRRVLSIRALSDLRDVIRPTTDH